MMELFFSALIGLLVIIDPPGCVPIYASLTTGATAEHRRAMAIRATVISFCILLVFGLFGKQLLGALGISLAAFRIAGGLMLFLIAIEMVFEKRTQRREERAQEVMETPEVEDVSVFPMAMPMLAGPGSIASVMLLIARTHDWQEVLIVLAALTTALVVTLIALLMAGPLMKIFGEKVEAVITRLLGVILAALAAQFVITGIGEAFRI